MSGGKLVVITQLYESAFRMAAGIAIVGHAAFAAFILLFVAVINGGQLAHAIVHVHANAAGYCQVKQG